ncbi:S1C family serine protease [Actinomadura rudentiformis]|uniref:PDZ domain-containing protein n=1 Tax=Actinomadura rudentiformis TaxID=359158 RepID=A0A6H9YBN3_9ACTN|nr:trypsin-like peptidase domain-containing protein [Actinomadura rudentiformis]KAB2341363.1 PDZ domain-containing protein [Actinomadura rudentiformis]
MTEDSREPVKASPGDDRVVAGYGAERAESAGTQDQADDLQQAAAGPQAEDTAEPDTEPGWTAEHGAVGSAGGDAGGGFAPPDPFAKDDVPRDTRPTAVETPLPEGLDPGRHRPGFVPHNQDPRAAAENMQGTPYGWPPQSSHQPPPPGAGGPVPPPPGGRPMGPPLPGGPRPMGAPGGFGAPPGGPNWAPVPPPPVPVRGGPSISVLAVIGLIIALVAGGVGAGVAVMASDDDGGSVSLGGGSGSGAGPAVKNRPPDSIAGIAQKVLPSVVMIRVETPGGQGGAGTGFIVNGGYIVTNNHVVSAGGGDPQIKVVFTDKKQLPATIKGRDPSSDIAVLKPEGAHSLPALTIGNSDDLAVGDPVVAIGSPLGLQSSVTSGIISSMNRAVPTRGEGGGDGSVLNAIQTDAAINPGNSGGPLVDLKGRVIGINTAIATLNGGQESGSIGLGFAIPINHGKRVAEEIISTGTAKRTQLGIGMDQRFPGPGVKISDTEQNGIVPIVKGGPAERAGLKPGDVITKINDQPIEDPADLSAQIRSKAPGDKVKVTYTRGGKEATVEVTLAAA